MWDSVETHEGVTFKQDCTVDGRAGPEQPYGVCIQSPGYTLGLAYSENERCTFNILKGGYLAVTSFDVDQYSALGIIAGSDIFRVVKGDGNQEDVRGVAGPQGLVVAPGDQLRWISDGFKNAPGWEICLVVGERCLRICLRHTLLEAYIACARLMPTPS